MDEKVYTVQELAEAWRCSIDTIYQMLALGKIQGFKVGGAWRITEAARRDYEQTPAIPMRRFPNRGKRSGKTVLKIT